MPILFTCTRALNIIAEDWVWRQSEVFFKQQCGIRKIWTKPAYDWLYISSRLGQQKRKKWQTQKCTQKKTFWWGVASHPPRKKPIRGKPSGTKPLTGKKPKLKQPAPRLNSRYKKKEVLRVSVTVATKTITCFFWRCSVALWTWWVYGLLDHNSEQFGRAG